MHFKVVSLSTMFLFVFSSIVLSHPGGLDKYGCHNDNIHGGYHCHNGSSSKEGEDSNILAVLAGITLAYGAYKLLSMNQDDFTSEDLLSKDNRSNITFRYVPPQNILYESGQLEFSFHF